MLGKNDEIGRISTLQCSTSAFIRQIGDEQVRISVLGNLRVEREDGSCFVPSARKERTVLALLALHANRTTSIETIIDEIWEQDPPKTSVPTARTYIYHLRGLFDDQLSDGLGGQAIKTADPGYCLCMASNGIDSNVFCGLVARGRQMMTENRFEDAAVELRQALDMWQGPALANVTTGRSLRAYVTFLEEERRRAKEMRITADMHLGRHRELVSEISRLVTKDPLNEWLNAQLMISLSRSGRRGEAFAVYANLRNELDVQLGIGPSRAIEQLHCELLSAG